MKLSNTSRRLLLVPALLLATNLFAANKGSLHISTSEKVAEEQLSAGDYTVQWGERWDERSTPHYAGRKAGGISAR